MADKKATHLGYEIVNKCPCGKEMRDDDRQELAFNHEDSKWYRVCRECINNHCQFFPDPPPPSEVDDTPKLAKVIPIR